MRQELAGNIVKLAMALQGACHGLTLDDIQQRFGVKRKTAERMRNIVESVFGPLELVDSSDRRKHWRLRSNSLSAFVMVRAEEIHEVELAAAALEACGHGERANNLRKLIHSTRAAMRLEHSRQADAKLESLRKIEILIPGEQPSQRLERGLIALLRDSITNNRTVEFNYREAGADKATRREVWPCGLLHGTESFLVAREHWDDSCDHPYEKTPRLWRLAGISEARTTGYRFLPDPTFNLEEFAKDGGAEFHSE